MPVHGGVARPRFRDKRTTRFANGERVKEFQAFEGQAFKRLNVLDAATRLEDLMALPSNRCKALGGDRKGQYSIRINDQWQICFEWSNVESAPCNIEIADYHEKERAL